MRYLPFWIQQNIRQKSEDQLKIECFNRIVNSIFNSLYLYKILGYMDMWVEWFKTFTGFLMNLNRPLFVTLNMIQIDLAKAWFKECM